MDIVIGLADSSFHDHNMKIDHDLLGANNYSNKIIDKFVKSRIHIFRKRVVNARGNNNNILTKIANIVVLPYIEKRSKADETLYNRYHVVVM